MSNPDWKDATSYARGERGVKYPTSWEIWFNGIRVWVSRGHRHYPGVWVMNCTDCGIKEREVGQVSDVTEEEAKENALIEVIFSMRCRILTLKTALKEIGSHMKEEATS